MPDKLIFTSGTQAIQGRTVNHDPLPWRNPNDGRRSDHGVKWISGPDIYDPRPEFTVTDNPILAEFRRYDSEKPEIIEPWLTGEAHLDELGDSASDRALEWENVEQWDDFQEHACQVLARLRDWRASNGR